MLFRILRRKPPQIAALFYLTPFSIRVTIIIRSELQLWKNQWNSVLFVSSMQIYRQEISLIYIRDFIKRQVRIIKNRKKTLSMRKAAVSYTHLDVYKRQS